jgi:hypothetical protein
MPASPEDQAGGVLVLAVHGGHPSLAVWPSWGIDFQDAVVEGDLGIPHRKGVIEPQSNKKFGQNVEARPRNWDVLNNHAVGLRAVLLGTIFIRGFLRALMPLMLHSFVPREMFVFVAGDRDGKPWLEPQVDPRGDEQLPLDVARDHHIIDRWWGITGETSGIPLSSEAS